MVGSALCILVHYYARLTMEGQYFLGERCLTEVRELLQFFLNSSLKTALE